MTEFERNIIGGGFCSIFSSIGCIGDSLSSGELEYTKDNGEKGYWDFFEYSWGQFLSKATGCKVYNFSRGGLTAKTFHVYADENTTAMRYCFMDARYGEINVDLFVRADGFYVEFP